MKFLGQNVAIDSINLTLLYPIYYFIVCQQQGPRFVAAPFADKVCSKHYNRYKRFNSIEPSWYDGLVVDRRRRKLEAIFSKYFYK